MSETPLEYLDYLTANIPDAREKDWLRPLMADQLKQRFGCSHEWGVMHFENWRRTKENRMSEIRFSDGLTIQTGGEYRLVTERDGLYLVGHGVCCPLRDREEGEKLLAQLSDAAKEAARYQRIRP